VFGLVSQVCPDLSVCAAVCLRIGGQKLAKILSVYTKTRWRPGLCPGFHWESSRRSLVRPPTSRTSGACTLWFALSVVVRDCGAQLMVTLTCVCILHYWAVLDLHNRWAKREMGRRWMENVIAWQLLISEFDIRMIQLYPYVDFMRFVSKNYYDIFCFVI